MGIFLDLSFSNDHTFFWLSLSKGNLLELQAFQNANHREAFVLRSLNEQSLRASHKT